MTAPRRLVVDSGDADEPVIDAPATRRAVARSVEHALAAGRPVTVHGPDDEAALDPAPCGCHALVRVWIDGQHGTWHLAQRQPGLPASPLVPVDAAAQAAASIAVNAPWPAELRVGLPLGTTWSVFTPSGALDPEPRLALDAEDIAAAVAALGDRDDVSISGPWSMAACIVTGRGGWYADLMSSRGVIDHTLFAADGDRERLLAVVRRAAEWVGGGT